jgi:hypothetical protein
MKKEQASKQTIKQTNKQTNKQNNQLNEIRESYRSNSAVQRTAIQNLCLIEAMLALLNIAQEYSIATHRMTDIIASLIARPATLDAALAITARLQLVREQLENVAFFRPNHSAIATIRFA